MVRKRNNLPHLTYASEECLKLLTSSETFRVERAQTKEDHELVLSLNKLQCSEEITAIVEILLRIVQVDASPPRQRSDKHEEKTILLASCDPLLFLSLKRQYEIRNTKENAPWSISPCLLQETWVEGTPNEASTCNPFLLYRLYCLSRTDLSLVHQ